VLINLGLLITGIALLALGGEGVVRGALAVSARLGISPGVTGLTIVGFGTSAPELVVSVDAAVNRLPDIAIANVIGSNISNVLLVLSVCALIAPLSISRRALSHDAMAMVAATVVFLLLAAGEGLGRGDGVVLLLALAAYLLWTYRTEVRAGSDAGTIHRAEASEIAVVPSSTWLAVVVLAGGFATLLLGSRLTLTAAVELGGRLGISDAVIGLSVVALGTSLPEFAVSVLATVRGHHAVAIGNVLGSNVFNLLGILGVSAMLQPLPLVGRMAATDQWVMLGATLLLVVLMFTGRRLTRLEGALLLGCYAAFITLLYWAPLNSEARAEAQPGTCHAAGNADRRAVGAPAGCPGHDALG
jgi:cation:H+ antiporter